MGLFFNKKQNSEYEKIILDVRNNLTDDKEENIKYIKKMFEKYKNHEMANEIIKELGRMIFENTSKEKQNELNELLTKDVISHFEKGEDYMRKGNLKNAKIELEQFVKTSEIFKEDRINIPYSPRNPIEFILCCNIDQNKKVRDMGIDYSTGYLRLGSIAIEENNIDKAIEYLKKSIKLNPYNGTAHFELIDALKRKGNLKLIKEEINESYKFIYLPNDLSRYYRDLGYYYIEKGDFRLAKHLYIYSIQFDNAKKDYVINELQYIFSRTGDDKVPSVEESYKYLENENIPVFFDKDNVGIILSLYKKVKEDKQENSPVGQLIGNIAEFYLKYIS